MLEQCPLCNTKVITGTQKCPKCGMPFYRENNSLNRKYLDESKYSLKKDEKGHFYQEPKYDNHGDGRIGHIYKEPQFKSQKYSNEESKLRSDVKKQFVNINEVNLSEFSKLKRKFFEEVDKGKSQIKSSVNYLEDVDPNIEKDEDKETSILKIIIIIFGILFFLIELIL